MCSSQERRLKASTTQSYYSIIVLCTYCTVGQYPVELALVLFGRHAYPSGEKDSGEEDVWPRAGGQVQKLGDRPVEELLESSAPAS